MNKSKQDIILIASALMICATVLVVILGLIGIHDRGVFSNTTSGETPAAATLAQNMVINENR
ncbi:hypothetical protein [Sphingobacterium bambusae]|uniref:Uncharacterized protein n=1 Tax=Sphingobacterium bambusae TaxID=662858 RepID=A0ABW6BAJ7_9SPHI|nr:hypothetical protein [Sphingobacterium bambusae]WPL48830.1 hypothetical protein SCB77_23030 [Sphingobacterium bambusae]